MTIPETVPELLRRHAAETPDRAALVTWDGGLRLSVTYGELDAITDRIACGIREAGLGPGDRLCLALDNSDAGAFYRLLHGAYKASVVPVPLNTRLMPAEIAHIVRDSGAGMLVGTDAVRDSLDGGGLDGCELAGLDLLPQLEDASGSPPRAPGLKHIADLLYTSGTTGLPKGSVFRHLSPALTAARLAHTLRLTSQDIFQTPAPVYTSTGTHTFPLPVLHAGATFVVEPAFDVEMTGRRLEAEGTSIFFGVPAMLMLLLERLPQELAFPRLSALMYGGSPMPTAVIERLLDRFSGIGMWNLYGLTEGGPTGCVLPPEFAIERPGSVGLPVEGTELRIVDDEGREPGPNQPGEIMLRSQTLMDGYYGAPELTAATIVDGWLHTGDIGSIDDDGFVYIVDRKKDMIIRGGFNVYPAEIENVLHQHPAVAEAAVIGVPHAVLGEEACAIVVLRGDADADIDEVEAFCAERLADFKRPRRWHAVDAISRNQMGKMLKSELRERYSGAGA